MRIKIIPLFILGIVPTFACAATVFDKWWEHDEICQIDDTRCYSTFAGINTEQWDISAGCRGMKYICAGALTTGGDESVIKTRAEIASGAGIKSDFDTNVYVSDGDCYGARKSKAGNTMVSVNGNYVRVWCNGILDNPADEILPNGGEFTTGAQPTCPELAARNIAAVLNGNCYGKYYNPNDYAIDCNGDTPILVLLNGADYNPNGRGATSSDTSSIFNSMISTSVTQRRAYFNR